MAQQLVISGSFSIPLEDGGALAQVDLSQKFNVSQRADFSRVYDAPVTDEVVSLGTLATGGAKSFVIKCKSGSCSVKLNGGTTVINLEAGAEIMYSNPISGWLTAALITTPGPAVVIFLAVA